MSYLYAPFTPTHSGNNFCNVSLLYLSLCLHFLFKPFTQTSDITLTCEISWVSMLPGSIPVSGCDCFEQFLQVTNLFPYICIPFFLFRYCQWGCALMVLFLCRESNSAQCRLVLSSVLISVLFAFFVSTWKTLFPLAGSLLLCFCIFLGFVLFCF